MTNISEKAIQFIDTVITEFIEGQKAKGLFGGRFNDERYAALDRSTQTDVINILINRGVDVRIFSRKVLYLYWD